MRFIMMNALSFISRYLTRDFKSIFLMVAGTGIVAIFSDPMVTVIGDFANTLKVIKPFYVSFLITPFCSNASELISSLAFAAKKRKENSSMTFSQLYGAATMNNTMCLGIFFALVTPAPRPGPGP